jgi:hypothetical protein
MGLEKFKMTEKEQELDRKISEKMWVLISEIEKEHGEDSSSFIMNILSKTVCTYANIIFKKPDDAINYFHKACLKTNKTMRGEK